MDHDLELVSPILEIVDRTIHISVLSWKYWIVRSIYQSYSGNIGLYDSYIRPILEILDRTIHTQSYPGNSGSYDPMSPQQGSGSDRESEK